MPPGTGLSAAQLLDLVDAGESADAAARGRLMLAAAAPDAPDDLTLGERDAWVLALRCGTYGDELASRVTCPSCGLALAVRIPRSHLAAVGLTTSVSDGVVVRIVSGAWVIDARPVDGPALALAASCADIGSARAALISSCVVGAWCDGLAVDALDVDEGVLEEVGEALVSADPGCELSVEMSCAGCGLEWSPVLDIVHYLWRELAASSTHLLDEVHQLAKGYGWTEEHVLVLSSRRRRQYVERLADA